jgi:hypothetical protein
MSVVTIKKEQDGLSRQAPGEDHETIRINETSLTMNLQPRFFRVGEYVFRNEQDAKKYLSDIKDAKTTPPAKPKLGPFGGGAISTGANYGQGTSVEEKDCCNCKCNSKAKMDTSDSSSPSGGGMARNKSSDDASQLYSSGGGMARNSKRGSESSYY